MRPVSFVKTCIETGVITFLSLTILSRAVFADGGTADRFWAHWSDGRAELDGYALVEPRYGQLRSGTAVLIFVTEDFSDSLRVKADPGQHPKSDVYPVLKLNFVRDFQTGIYDYNLMSSIFLRPDFGAAEPWPLVKVSFSAEEWCGHVYEQWLKRGPELIGVSHSYFDGEADRTRTLPYPPGGIVEEALPILVRDLRGDLLPPGGQKSVPFLPSQMRERLGHKPAHFGQALISRSKESAEVDSVLGRRVAYQYQVIERDGPTTTFTVEAAYPHRLLAWQRSDGETGRLLGSTRLAYWQLNHLGDEKYLRELGLPIPPGAPLKSP